MNALPQNFIVATAGHVDHGKSSLVRALTGVDPDRLTEEKKRGISIELGFAPLHLSNACGTPLSIGIVDVPGHEDFVQTMVSGVAAADAALLVIAADDGPMPQTFEHLQILQALDVGRGLIALSKVDRVEDVEAAVQRVRKLLERTHFADVPIVPISVINGTGLDALRRAICQVLLSASPRPDIGKPRMWIDRAFSSAGVGTIVTGTLVGGSLAVGQSVTVQPGGQTLRIRSLHSHHQPLHNALPASRVAVNLPDASINPADKHGVSRGQLLTLESVGVDSAVLDAQLSGVTHPLRDGVEISFHLGTAQTVARLHNYDSAEGGLVRLKLARALPMVIGDRFVLRTSSSMATLGGGVVLDPIPGLDRHWRRNANQLRLLTNRQSNLNCVDRMIKSQLERVGYAPIDDLRKIINCSEIEIRETIDRLAKQDTLKSFSGLLVGTAFWQRLLEEIDRAVNAFHEAFPQRPGLPLPTAHNIVTRHIRHDVAAAKIIFESILEDTSALNFTRSANVLRLRSFCCTLPPRLQKLGERLRAALAAGGLNVASRKVLAASDDAAEALRFLIANGEAVELSRDLAISSAAYDSAAGAVREHLEQGPLTVSEIKSLLSSSRRMIVPLLERFDREGITRRRGDVREMGPSG